MNELACASTQHRSWGMGKAKCNLDPRSAPGLFPSLRRQSRKRALIVELRAEGPPPPSALLNVTIRLRSLVEAQSFLEFGSFLKPRKLCREPEIPWLDRRYCPDCVRLKRTANIERNAAMQCIIIPEVWDKIWHRCSILHHAHAQ